MLPRIVSAPLLSLLLLLPGCSMPHRVPAPIHSSDAFSRMKALQGEWQTKGSKTEPAEKIIYRVTSGGSAVEEILFPGTEHEMVSVYYPENDSLSMTHYCMQGNRPKLSLVKDSGDAMTLALASDAEIDPSRETHMHQVTFTFFSPDKIRQEWLGYRDGKPADRKVIELTRAPVHTHG